MQTLKYLRIYPILLMSMMHQKRKIVLSLHWVYLRETCETMETKTVVCRYMLTCWHAIQWWSEGGALQWQVKDSEWTFWQSFVLSRGAGLSSHKIISCVSSLFCPLTQVLSGCQGAQVGFILDSSCGHLHFLDIFPGVRTWLFSGRFHWDSVKTIVCHPSVELG